MSRGSSLVRDEEGVPTIDLPVFEIKDDKKNNLEVVSIKD